MACSASWRSASTSGSRPRATSATAFRLSDRRSIERRTGSRTASKRTPQSTSGTYISRAPACARSVESRTVPTDSVRSTLKTASAPAEAPNVAKNTRATAAYRRKAIAANASRRGNPSAHAGRNSVLGGYSKTRGMATPKTTVQIVMPAMGESVTEGVLLTWHKQVGDPVAEGEPLVEVSTDKVDADVPAPATGVLAKILVQADETVQVGAVLGEIDAGAEPAAVKSAPAQSNGEATAQPSASEPSGAAPPAANGAAEVTPVAARMAASHGLDVSQIPGTGPRGRVTKGDVEDAVAAPSGKGPSPAETTVIRGPAATLVRFREESRDTPTATSFRTLPVDAL